MLTVPKILFLSNFVFFLYGEGYIIMMRNKCRIDLITSSLGYGSRDAIVHNGKLREICPQIFPDLLKVQQNDLAVKDHAYEKVIK